MSSVKKGLLNTIFSNTFSNDKENLQQQNGESFIEETYKSNKNRRFKKPCFGFCNKKLTIKLTIVFTIIIIFGIFGVFLFGLNTRRIQEKILNLYFLNN